MTHIYRPQDIIKFRTQEYATKYGFEQTTYYGQEITADKRISGAHYSEYPDTILEYQPERMYNHWEWLEREYHRINNNGGSALIVKDHKGRRALFTRTLKTYKKKED